MSKLSTGVQWLCVYVFTWKRLLGSARENYKSGEMCPLGGISGNKEKEEEMKIIVTKCRLILSKKHAQLDMALNTSNEKSGEKEKANITNQLVLPLRDLGFSLDDVRIDDMSHCCSACGGSVQNSGHKFCPWCGDRY
jgi:hypothetical protein